MGAAAYSRGSRVLQEQISWELSSRRNTLEAKAQLWRKLLAAGVILHFRCGDGAALTAGPYCTAVPQPAKRYLLIRWGGKWACEVDGSAWSTALLIIEHVGRSAPYEIT